jgi:hypothetical protein
LVLLSSSSVAPLSPCTTPCIVVAI